MRESRAASLLCSRDRVVLTERADLGLAAGAAGFLPRDLVVRAAHAARIQVVGGDRAVRAVHRQRADTLDRDREVPAIDRDLLARARERVLARALLDHD